jgi:hypothetical protein
VRQQPSEESETRFGRGAGSLASRSRGGVRFSQICCLCFSTSTTRLPVTTTRHGVLYDARCTSGNESQFIHIAPCSRLRWQLLRRDRSQMPRLYNLVARSFRQTPGPGSGTAAMSPASASDGLHHDRPVFTSRRDEGSVRLARPKR